MQDYSEWLDNADNRISLEETAWAGAQLHMNYAAHIALMRTKFKIFNVVELGCGSGWVPTQFGPDLRYVGVDKNISLLHMAEEKNLSSRQFVQADIRNTSFLKALASPELVCSFAVLKHFSLEEFEFIFSGMLSLAPYGLFSVNIANEVRDDGIDFHHIWVTKEWLAQIIDKNGFKLVYKTIMWQGKTWETKTGEESIFAVERK